jgi:hypothetical protein
VAGACFIKGHKSKGNLVPEMLHVKHSRNGHACLEPSLPVKFLSDYMPLVKMMGKDLSLEIWTAHFGLLKAEQAGALKCSSTSSSSMASPSEEVKIPTLESLQAASDSFTTLKKLRLGAVLGPNTIPVTSRPQGMTFSNVTPLDIDNKDSVERSKIQCSVEFYFSTDLHGI